jgi:ABC-type transport system involved in multi-copper enzyme maturation permease subunit
VLIADIFQIGRKEWRNFIRSDRSVFIIYLFLILFWSVFLVSNLLTGTDAMVPTIGLVFFSVIVSGNFSNVTFTAERLNGSMEILLTCGLSRIGILMGKHLFIMAVSMVMGAACYGLCILWAMIFNAGAGQPLSGWRILAHAGIYTSACYMNASCGAWLSLRLANPRVSYFVNFLVIATIVGLYELFTALVWDSGWTLPLILIVVGTIMLSAAIKDFSGERVIHPVQM